MPRVRWTEMADAIATNARRATLVPA